MPSENYLSISGVTKSFGTVRALDNVNLDIAEGEFFALLGSVRVRQINAFASYGRI